MKNVAARIAIAIAVVLVTAQPAMAVENAPADAVASVTVGSFGGAIGSLAG